MDLVNEDMVATHMTYPVEHLLLWISESRVETVVQMLIRTNEETTVNLETTRT